MTGKPAPQPGDTVLACKRKPDPHNCHVFGFPEPVAFARAPRTDRRGLAKWLLLCDACFVEAAPLLEIEVADGRGALALLARFVGYDFVWPNNLRLEYKSS